MNLLEQFKLLRKISEVCSEPIMIEDLFLLLSIYHRNESNLDVELQHEIKYYYLQFQFYDASSDSPTLISWVKRVEYLMKLGLLEAPYNNWIKEKNGYKVLDILKLEVTSKFVQECLVDSAKKDVVWNFAIEEWGGEWNYVNGEKFPNRIPSRDYWKLGLRTEENLRDLFWKIAESGSKTGIIEIFETMKAYKEYINDGRSLTRFLTEYDTIKKILKNSKNN